MFDTTRAFGGFSVDDVDAAESFYRDILGIDVERGAMGILELRLASGARIVAYPKPDHRPASFTILNLGVDDVEAAVDTLNEAGVVTTIYSDEMPVDSKGIMRGNGPDIAWFRDPAGNVISVIDDRE
ncbi:MAG: hypothetical protein RI885_2748 [Actinomycetota bacterium]|jgi:catechol 2,3-dioxygenase-like lactoylglutathione lyase family enzyme